VFKRWFPAVPGLSICCRTVAVWVQPDWIIQQTEPYARLVQHGSSLLRLTPTTLCVTSLQAIFITLVQQLRFSPGSAFHCAGYAGCCLAGFVRLSALRAGFASLSLHCSSAAPGSGYSTTLRCAGLSHAAGGLCYRCGVLWLWFLRSRMRFAQVPLGSLRFVAITLRVHLLFTGFARVLVVPSLLRRLWIAAFLYWVICSAGSAAGCCARLQRIPALMHACATYTLPGCTVLRLTFCSRWDGWLPVHFRATLPAAVAGCRSAVFWVLPLVSLPHQHWITFCSFLPAALVYLPVRSAAFRRMLLCTSCYAHASFASTC